AVADLLRVRADARRGGESDAAALAALRPHPRVHAAGALDGARRPAAQCERQGRPAAAERTIWYPGNMPQTDVIVDHLIDLFARTLHVEVPSADTDLIEAGLLDSLQLVQLLLQVEMDMGLRIPLDEIDLDDLRSVRRLAHVIAARREPERI